MSCSSSRPPLTWHSVFFFPQYEQHSCAFNAAMLNGFQKKNVNIPYMQKYIRNSTPLKCVGHLLWRIRPFFHKRCFFPSIIIGKWEKIKNLRCPLTHPFEYTHSRQRTIWLKMKNKFEMQICEIRTFIVWKRWTYRTLCYKHFFSLQMCCELDG